MSNEVFGACIEKRKHWFVSPAILHDGVVTCHDLAGFGGSWKAKEGYIFVESESGESLCKRTFEKADAIAAILNDLVEKEEVHNRIYF